VASRSSISDWLALVLTPGLGTRRFAGLCDYFGSESGWIGASDRDLANAGLNHAQLKALREPDPASLQRCLAWLAADDHRLVPIDDDYYPPLLRDIADPPPAIFVAGQPEHLLRPQLAIVGSRNATAGGLEHARSFAAELAASGLVITSGLAAGVDGHAHAACMDAGGQTVAVAGTGLDRVYPARHRDLAQRIVRQGAMVSTFVPGTEPRSGHFPARNRLISGMTLGTLVIEAGQRSGSLITARLASEQGREVFAIPGSIHNPLARGCHRLIREGAKLIETAEEILEELRPLSERLGQALSRRLASQPDENSQREQTALGDDLDEDHRRVLEAIGYDPVPVDEIIRRTQLTAAEVSSTLLLLELNGHATAHPGGRYSRTQ
jgi:DNA processing protein